MKDTIADYRESYTVVTSLTPAEAIREFEAWSQANDPRWESAEYLDWFPDRRTLKPDRVTQKSEGILIFTWDICNLKNAEDNLVRCFGENNVEWLYEIQD